MTKKIILASASPRRKELLATILPDFQVIPSTVEENIDNEPFPPQLVEKLALDKALDVSKKVDFPAVIIGSDTVVTIDNKILGKPKDEKDPKTALCFDMLAPEGYGEIIGGSQRSTDIAAMTERLRQMGENVQNYEWYFDLRRYGSVPHAGYGLGVERLVAWICKAENIKDTIPFPRTLLRFRP